MALITNIKSGTTRSTKKNLPRLFDKTHRIRAIGGGTPNETFDNSICNGTVSCMNGIDDPRDIEVQCNPTS